MTRIPFLRLLLPFIAGILCYIFLSKAIFQYVVLSIIGLTLFLFYFLLKDPFLKTRFQLFPGFGINLLFFSGAAILTHYNTYSNHPNHVSKLQGNYIIAEVVESLSEKKNSYQTIIEARQLSNGKKSKNATGRILIYLAKDPLSEHLRIGDKILIENRTQKIKAAQNPGQFNYKQYLEFHQIYSQAYLASGHWKLLENESSINIQSYFDRVRNEMLKILSNHGFSENEFAIAAALLLGKKDALDPELIQTFASAGAMHVLAVSGLHVGILFMVLNLLLKFLDRNFYGRIVKALILLFTVWMYAALTGLSPSVVRASTMFSAMILGGVTGYRSSTFNTIASSAFILLFVNPYYLMEVGFQLSYLAVLSIVYIQPKLYNLWTVPTWLGDKIWGISSVSIAAQIGTFPLGLLYFHQFPTLFLFSNLVVIPGAFIILASGILFFMVTGLNLLIDGTIQFLVDFIANILWWCIKGLNVSVKFVEEIPHSLITGIDISIGESWLLYGGIVFIFIYLAYKRFYWIIAVLVISNAFCIQQINEDAQLRNLANLTIYHVNNSTAINFMKQNENILLCDSSLMKDDQKQLFHIKNNWNKQDAVDPVYINYQIPDSSHHRVLSNGFYQFKGDLIAHIHKEKKPLKSNRQLFVDLLIVSDNVWMNWDEIKETYHPKMVVIDSSIKKYIAKKWHQQMEDLEINYWDVGRDGAFVKAYSTN